MSGLPQRLLVCGGRDFSNSALVYRVLEELHSAHRFTLVIHGGERGVDSLTDAWAMNKRLPIEAYRPDWPLHGKLADAKRQVEMLRSGRPTMLVAFPGGKGTKNLVQLAYSIPIPTIILYDEHGASIRTHT